MSYRFVQGIDYGPRKGTLGLSFHMSEGTDNLADGFLARKAGESDTDWRRRVNGVSCHVAILSTGEVVQMLGWGRTCGNLNPDDRAAEYGYYGHHYLVDVLGDGWPDPNEWTLSAELAGFRSKGPTQAQVESAIKWGNEMKALFPTLRGATGHHDQSPKECPGLTPNMKAIFTGVGGHGLWQEELVQSFTVDPVTLKTGTLILNGPGHYYLRLADNTGHGPLDATDPAWVNRPAFGPVKLLQPWVGETEVYVVGTEAAAIRTVDCTFAPDILDCADAVAAAVKAGVNAALDHVVDGVAAAIAEARIR